MDQKEANIKQIIIVTDGKSNVGGDPVSAAKEAYYSNIIVNTIGIIDQRQEDEGPLAEIVGIAEAGGGLYEYSYIDELYQTMQSLTHKTVNKTIQDAVNKQLRDIIGQELDDILPESRSKLLHYIDSYSDVIHLQTCILLDTSGSMAKKILSARYSILDLVDSFKARGGRADIAVITYPGGGGENCKLLFNFDEDLACLEERLYTIETKGITPTGPAIYYAIETMKNYDKKNIGKEILELEGGLG